MVARATRLALLSMAAVGGFALSSQAAITTQWTFETSLPVTTGPIAPELGSGAGSTVHAGGTVVTNPAGNGSAHSFSSTIWAVGDYYQFTFPAASGLFLTFDQTSSNTGPRNFKIQTSTDGTTYSDLSTYIALANGGAPNAAWNATTGSPAYTTANVILPANTQGVRLVVNSTVSANGGVLATGGTDRVDNVTISDAPVIVPEPASLSALALGGVLLLRRRK